MNSYRGITFAKGYSKPFADFKEEFGSTHIFNEIHPEEREQELKKAFEIATSKSVNEIEVKEAKILKPNGDTSRAVIESEKNTAK